MNKNQIKGRFEQAKGQVKQVAGRIVGNKEWEEKGRLQKTGGRVQSGYGDVKKDIEDST